MTHPGLEPFQRELRSDLASFASLVVALGAWAAQASVPQRTLSSVVLLLDELFSNVVLHGFRGHPGGRVIVRVGLQGPCITVTLRDNAPPFDPLQVPAPNLDAPLEKRQVGGLGIVFVRRLADSMSYRRVAEDDDHWNELTLTLKMTTTDPQKSG